MSVLHRLLSHDLPRNRWLAASLVLVLLGLAAAPFLFPGSKPLGVAAKMLVFILLVASYDLLLGYTGIVSFAHNHVLRHRGLWRGDRQHPVRPGVGRRWRWASVWRCCCRSCCRW